MRYVTVVLELDDDDDASLDAIADALPWVSVEVSEGNVFGDREVGPNFRS